jgi:hypothetical protein
VCGLALAGERGIDNPRPVIEPGCEVELHLEAAVTQRVMLVTCATAGLVVVPQPAGRSGIEIHQYCNAASELNAIEDVQAELARFRRNGCS